MPVGSPVWAMKPLITRWNDDAVVEMLAHQLLDPGDMLGRQVGPQLDHHPAIGEVDVERVLEVGGLGGVAAPAKAGGEEAAIGIDRLRLMLRQLSAMHLALIAF